MLKKLEWHLDLPVEHQLIWDFFSKPQNLNHLTPEEVNFKIEFVSTQGDMYPGMMVKYKIAPLPIKWVSFSWVAEIKQVNIGDYFIDEQRFGPFSFWHHEHRFQPLNDGGVRITDILIYRLPFGILGRIADRMIIGNLINRIFNERKKLLEKMFVK
jgi:ligand-binding SRPBCC domain-containing protein